jgi:MarR family 2-MHQ and catechol resistance regulon transcriptional repressor
MPKNSNYQILAELICDLTRNCNIKEEYFANSFNLSPTEVRFLKLFAFQKALSIKELKEKLALSSGRITHILQSLEDKKLLIRYPDEKDKRNIMVKLLPKAFPLIDNLLDNYDRLHRDILKNVKSSDIENIYTSLQILVDVFKKWVEEE